MSSRYALILSNSIKCRMVLIQKLSFRTLKSNYHVLSWPIQHNSRIRKTFYATAAYKESVLEDAASKNNALKENTNSLDSALSKVDWIAKLKGRILLKNVEAAFNMINEKEITTTHGLYLLRCCKYVISEPPPKRIELANQIWNRFQELGIAFDVRHYNALLEVHINNYSTFNPADILNSMEEQNIEPNKMTCLLLINKYCKDGNLSGASEILHFMKEKGFPANEEVFNHLIEAHLRNNDFAGAKDLLEVMGSSDLKPTEETYSLIASFYAANGNMKEMMSYLTPGEKVPQHILLSDSSKMKVLEALAISGNHQSFGNIFNLMEDIHQNSQECINLAVELIHKGFIDAAYKLIINLPDSQCSQGTNVFIKQLIKNRRIFNLMEDIHQNSQECINLAVELIHKGFIDAAYKLIINLPDSQCSQGTNVFIKQLIKNRRPVSEIVNFCNDILEKGINNLIFINAARAAVDFGNFDCATAIFKERLAKGYPIRASHFWPMISILKETGSLQEIWTVLEKMSELGIPADFSMYLEHIFPALGVPQPEDVIINVKKAGQIVETANDALFVYYCNLGEIHLAYLLIQTVPVGLNLKLDFKNFLKKYQDLQIEKNNRDLKDKYFEVLKYILQNIKILGQEHETKVLKGTYLAELILLNPQLFVTLLENEGITFSEDVLNVCEKHLMKKNPDSMVFLMKMKNKITRSNKEEVNMSSREENEHLNYLQSQNLSCKTFLTERIFHHIKIKNVDRLSELLSLYENEAFSLSPLMLADLIALSSTAADVKNATKYFLKLKHDFPSFKLDLVKLFDYSSLLVKYSEFDETLNVLKDSLTEPYIFVNKDVAVRSIKRFTTAACNTQNVEFVKCIKNLLIPISESLGSKEIYLEPLINVHLNRRDLSSAVNEYQDCIMRYHIPASFSGIIKKCIYTGDKRTLQSVTDMTISYIGKNVTLAELAVACIEIGHNTEALRVIQNLHHEANQDVFEDICIRLGRNNKLAELEKFIDVANSIHHDLNAKNLYLQLLKHCAAQNEYNKAMKVFNTIRRKGIEPSSEMVDILINLLKRNDQPIPVSVLSVRTAASVSTDLTKATEDFIKHLQEENAELALYELSILKKGYIRTLSAKNLSDLVHLCLEKNCVKDLSSNVYAMSYIIENAKDVLKPIFENYSAAGDVEKFVAIANFIPDFALKHIGFSKYFSEAFILSGKQENLLSELEERCNKKVKLFTVAALEELVKFPEFEERIIKLVVRYLDSGFEVPIVALWAHHFVTENYDRANEIYQISKPSSFPIDKVDSKIIRAIRQDKNVALGEKYVNFVNQINPRQRVKERAYGALLDVLVLKERYKDAVDLVLEAEKLQLLLHKHFRSTLVTLKSALEKDKKTVPFTIPPEAVLSDISSNSE